MAKTNTIIFRMDMVYPMIVGFWGFIAMIIWVIGVTSLFASTTIRRLLMKYKKNR
jgi:type IV secretory pathway VirB2 component (pilin)